MATTKLWKFKSRLDRLINYAINGEKTENKLYVSGINCMPDTAFYEMTNVKKQFFKTGGIECYHGYQSFVEGEVTPEQAHEIGVKLAEEIWGNKFQVIVSTHLNTNNIHNHFVLNSVSFVDGKRFCNTKKDYAVMRKVSDRLCEEYGISVLKQEEKYNKYATSSLYKELMRDSIDYAIANAKDYNEFIRILEDLDYTVTDKNNTLSIRREPYKRNTRIERQFGNNYSKENIYKRILETQPEFPYSPNPYLLIDRTYKNYNYIREKHYQNKGSIHKINTEEQLNEFEKEAYKKLAPLKSERENLWKKHKKARTDDDRKLIEKQIAEISKRITPLAEEIRHCKNIQKRMEKIKKFELHQQLENEKKEFEKEQIKKKQDRNR